MHSFGSRRWTRRLVCCLSSGSWRHWYRGARGGQVSSVRGILPLTNPDYFSIRYMQFIIGLLDGYSLFAHTPNAIFSPWFVVNRLVLKVLMWKNLVPDATVSPPAIWELNKISGNKKRLLNEKVFLLRYHIGESMLASIRHFLRFVELDSVFDSYGFIKKVSLGQHAPAWYKQFFFGQGILSTIGPGSSWFSVTDLCGTYAVRRCIQVEPV